MEDRPIYQVSASAVVTTMCAVFSYNYELLLYKLGLDPDCNTARDVLMATGHEPTVPVPYKGYAEVILESDLESMPSHGLQDLAIELLNSKQPP
jgi:hypothetical protein